MNDLYTDHPFVYGEKSGKGGGSSGAKEAPNTVQSEAMAKIIDLVSSGEIEGWANADPLKCVFLDSTPIRNSDGTDNFQGIDLDYRVGTPDQDYLEGFDEQGSTVEIGTESTASIWPIHTVVNPIIDAVGFTTSIPALSRADKKTGDVNGYTVQYAIDLLEAGSGTWEEVDGATLYEKFTSNFELQHRISLVGRSFPVSLRLRRITPDAADLSIQNRTYLAFVVELVEGKLSYPNCAIMGLTARARQFGDRIPARTYHIKGLKCVVPANYNPVTREYGTSGEGTDGGVWDGTFKIAWTDNPAWILFSLLVNTDWGMGDLISYNDVDKWTLYEISQHCDELVNDGYGGLEPRYTLNAYIQTREEAYKTLQSVASVFQGMLYATSAKVMFAVDKPKDEGRLVTNANVIGGQFIYEGFSRESRHSVAAVTWNDPAQLGKPGLELYEDPALIAKLGWKVTDVFAFGCTSRGQARRMGRWTIFSEKYETRTCSFRTDINFADVTPGTILKVADAKRQGIRAGGRLREVSSTSATLDDTITIVAGVEYVIWITLPDNTVTSVLLNNAPGSTDTVTWSTPLAVLPQTETVFIIASGDFDPPLYRVVSMNELGGKEPFLEFVCIRYYAEKFEAIEENVLFDPSPETAYNLSDPVPSPQNGSVVRVVRNMASGSSEFLVVSYDKSDSILVSGYRYIWRFQGGDWIEGRTFSDNFEITYRGEGAYEFRVYAIGPNGRESIPEIFSYVASEARPITLPTIANFGIKEELVATSSFTGQVLKLTWDIVPPSDYTDATDWIDPFFRDYEVKVEDGASNILAYYYVTDNYFEISAEKYRELLGGYSRSVVVGVRVRDTFDTATSFTTRTFTNPAPSVVSPTLLLSPNSIGFNFAEPDDPDYEGIIVWMDTASGFTPGAGNQVHKGRGLPNLVVDANTTYYIVHACYDAFGSTGLTLSSEVSVTTPGVTAGDLDTTAPAVPTGLGLTSAVSTNPDGSQLILLTAAWTGVADSDLDHYEVALQEGAGSFVVALTTGLSFTWVVKGSTSYTAKVLACDRLGNRSAYTATVNVTSTADSSAPSAPTSFTVVAGVTSLSLSWINPAAIDLDSVEIYENTVNNSGTATRIATKSALNSLVGSFTRSGLATGVTRYYWLKSRDTTGNLSAFTTVSSGTTASIVAGDLDTTAPAVPTGLGLTSAVSTNPDGSQMIILTATWTGVADSDLDHYEVALQEGAGTFIDYATAGLAYTWVVKGSTSYTAKVLACDRLGNRSAYTSTVNVTSTADSSAPSAPTSVAVTAGLTALTISWSNPAAADLDSIEIYENTVNNSGTATRIATKSALSSTANSFSRTGLATGVTRYYWLKSRDTTGNLSAFTTVVSGTTSAIVVGDLDTTAPAVPTGLGLTSAVSTNPDGSQLILLTAAWTGVADADLDHYEIALQEGAGSFIVSVTTGVSFTWVVKGSTSYTAKVLACDKLGNRSAYTSTVTVTSTADSSAPSAPTSVSVTAGVTALTLFWTNPTAADLDSVEIYENTVNNSGTATRIATKSALSATANSFSRTGLATGVTRYYWLKSRDTTGNLSAFTTVASGTTSSIVAGDLDTTAPAVPTGLGLTSAVTTNPDGSQLVILTATWTGVADADLDHYEIALQEGAGSFVVSATAGLLYTWVVKGSTSYTAKVLACDKLGNRSAYTSTVTVTSTVDSSAPAAPTSPSVTAGVTSLTLFWTNPTAADLDSIEIYENTISDSSTATRIASKSALSATANSFSRTGLATGVTRYYWLKSRDTTGNLSAFTTVVSGTTSAIVAGDLDTTAPAVPTGLGLTSAVSTNPDGSQLIILTAAWTGVADSDFDHYEVALQEGAGTFIVGFTSGVSFTWVVKGSTSYTAKVLACDKLGNRSAYTSTVTVTSTADSSAPSAPTSPAVTAGLTSLTISWTNPSAADLDSIEIYENTVNNSGTATYIASKSALSTTNNSFSRTGLATGVTRYYWLKARDTSGNVSAFTTVVSGTTSAVVAGDLDTTAPAVPTGLGLTSAVSTNPDGSQLVILTAAWTGVADADLDHYEIALQEGAGSFIAALTSGLSFTWVVKGSTSYTAKVLACDKLGNRSAYTATVNVTSTADSSAPSAPTSLSVTAGLTALSLSWTNATASDLHSVEIYENTANDSGTATRIASKSALSNLVGSFTRSGLATGVTRYYWLKSRDTTGNLSAFSSVASGTTSDISAGDFDTTAPAVPTGLGLTSTVSTNTDGSQLVILTAAWTGVADSDLDHYEVALQEDAGSFIVATTTGVSFSWVVKGSTSYTAKVLACDKLGNRSSYTSTVNVTSTADSSAPSAPTSVSVTAGLSSLTISWTNPTAADLNTIEIYENTTNNSGTATRIATKSALSASGNNYSRTGLATGVTRYYWLKARDTTGNLSAFTTVASGTTSDIVAGDFDTTAPAVPTGLGLTSAVSTNPDGSQLVILTAAWTGVGDSDLDHYEVALQEGAGTFIVAITTGVSFTWVVKGSTSYTVKVLACDKLGNRSAYTSTVNATSTADSSAPAAPTSLAVTAGLTSLTLSWTNASAADLDSVEIYENTTNTSGTATRIASKSALTTLVGSFSRTGLATGVTRYYWLKSRDTTGNLSAFSSGASGTTSDIVAGDFDTTAPAVPTGLGLSSAVSTNPDGSQVVILTAAWTGVGDSDLDHYEVAIQEGAGSFIVAFTTGVSFTWVVKGSTSYTVKVLACDKLGNRSAYTSTVNATSTADSSAPAAPTSLAVTAGLTSLTLSWTNASAADLDSVEIYENTTNTSGTATRIASKSALTTLVGSFSRTGLATGVTRYYWLKSRDTTGNLSAFSSGASGTTSIITTGDLDSTAPAVPTGLGLTSAVSTNPDGSQLVILTAAWTGVADSDLDHYEIALQEGAGSFIVSVTTGVSFTWVVKGSTSYTAKVLACDKLGNRSAYTSTVNVTSTADSSAPSAPTSLTATAVYGGVLLTWTNPSASDFEGVEIYENTTNTSGTATRIFTKSGIPSTVDAIARTGFGSGVTRYYWLKSRDTTGNLSAFTSSVNATTSYITGSTDINAGTVGSTQLGTGAVTTVKVTDGNITNIFKARTTNTLLLTSSYASYSDCSLVYTPTGGGVGQRIAVFWGYKTKGGANQTNVVSAYLKASGQITGDPPGISEVSSFVGNSDLSQYPPPNNFESTYSWVNSGDTSTIGAAMDSITFEIMIKFGSGTNPPTLTGGYIVIVETLR